MASYKNVLWMKLFLFINVTACLYGLSYIVNPSNQSHNEESSDIYHKNIKNNDIIIKTLLTENGDQRFRQKTISDNTGEYRFGNINKDVICNCQCPQANNEDKEQIQKTNSESLMLPPVKIGQDFDHSKEFQVPNIVHYIWYNTEPAHFEFHHMISVMSANKYINPDVIYFHTDTEPIGEFWEKTKELSKLKIVKRDPPVHIFGEDVKPPKFYTSHSNVDRLKVLMEYGGIYLDFDVFVTKSFDDLRKHVCTIGFESDEKSCGSIVVSSKDAFFLILWINSYFDDYKTDEWAYNTGQVPFNLAKRFPHLVHVEMTKLNRPNFQELNVLYGDKTWNWRDNYAVHTWYRLWKTWSGMYQGVEPNPDNIKTLNNTFGQIARSVLFDTSDIIK